MTGPAVDIIPARRGKAVALAKGQTIRVINTPGTQVLDTWAFNRGDLGESMSMEHSRSFNSKIMLGVGDSYVSERRRPMLTVVEDTSPGIHDTLLCACNRYIYEEQGCREYHRNCTDNLHEALAEMGLKIPFTPAPLNLFMNIPVNPDHSISRLPPVSRAGDHVRLKAAMDLVVVFSACPQDMSPINGAQKTPRDAHYAVEG